MTSTTKREGEGRHEDGRRRGASPCLFAFAKRSALSYFSDGAMEMQSSLPSNTTAACYHYTVIVLLHR